MQQKVSGRFPKEMRVSNEGGEFILQIERPLRYSEFGELIHLHPSRTYKEAIRSLYRASNLPQIDMIDPQRLAMIDKHYPPGVVIEGCVINRVVKDYVEIKVEPNLFGGIHISEWSNTFIEDLGDVAKINEEIDAAVIRREENGFLRLSRKNAALAAYEVNRRYRGIVQTVSDSGAEILLTKTENGQAIKQPLTGYVQKFQIKFVPKDSSEEFYPEQYLQQGQEVISRILSIDRENGRILLTLWRLYDVILDVPGLAKVGWYFSEHQKNRKELERITETQILIEKDINQAGKITISSASMANIQKAVSSLKQNISGLQEQRQVTTPVSQPPKVRPNAISSTVTSRGYGLPSVKEEPKGCLTIVWNWIKDAIGL
jgi:predicted RNA-binding protein with RPS1 domain